MYHRTEWFASYPIVVTLTAPKFRSELIEATRDTFANAPYDVVFVNRLLPKHGWFSRSQLRLVADRIHSIIPFLVDIDIINYITALFGCWDIEHKPLWIDSYGLYNRSNSVVVRAGCFYTIFISSWVHLQCLHAVDVSLNRSARILSDCSQSHTVRIQVWTHRSNTRHLCKRSIWCSLCQSTVA